VSNQSVESTWRQALDENWDQVRALTDWMGIPTMHDHVAEMHTGGSREKNGDWVDYSLTHHIGPLAERLAARDGRPDRKLSMVSFGCGTGEIERQVLDRGWPIGRLVCREFDTSLLDRAQLNVKGLCSDQEFQQFDFNRPESVGYEEFDIVFFCHSIHHCTNIERFLVFLNQVIAKDGIILGLDYFGPTRLQVSYEVKVLLDEIFRAFPEHLRFNIGTRDVEQSFSVDSIATIAKSDPSEAPRSADLRSLLFSTFPVREQSPMGGTLLRPLLAQRAGNFRNPSDHCVLKLLMILERELIRSGRLISDNLYFVLEKTSRL
jgi:SAM-dependent methyltransferase